MPPERDRLTYALGFSLLIHALLLRLTFGGQGLGLPGFNFPWQDRRVQAPDLRVVLVPPPVALEEPSVAAPTTEPLQQGRIEQRPARGPALTPSAPRAPNPRGFAAAIAPESNPKVEASPTTEANPTAQVNPNTEAAAGAPAAKAPLRADRSASTPPPPIPASHVIALERIDEPTWVVPATPAMQTPVVLAGPTASERAEAAREKAARQQVARAENARSEIERQGAALQEAARQTAALQEASRQLAARQQAALQEAARQETERQEVARQATASQEAARQLAADERAALQEAARQTAALQEAARQVEARQEAAQQEAARVEAARVEAARVEAARVEAARVEAARVETARVEAARVEAARVEAARVEAARAEAQEAEARREARLRAIGQQLDAEAAQREAMAAANPSPSLPPPSWRPARRYRLFGRTDSNEEVIRYAEAWERKIQLNMTSDRVREVAKQPHTDPLVTVAIRSDGSVESVTFVQSSGVAAIDDAIRRIVDSQKPYQVFPPGLAREYDVLEIRRTWHFDMAIWLY